MSKFIFTTSQEKTNQSVEVSTKYGYILSGRFDHDKFSYACYYKLAVKNENFLAIGNDFVSFTGTVIYKDSIGKESLKKIYDDFNGDVNIIRDNMIGNGAFIIKKGDEITIFNDYLSLYYIYYTINNGTLIVSNDLYDVCNLCDNLEADYDNLILRSLIYGVYGGESEIKNVKYLQDCEKITINTVTGKYDVQAVNVDWRGYDNLSYEEHVACIGEYMKKAAASLVKHFGTPALSSTGGLDNRLNLAAFLSIGAKPDLIYGVGNSSMTNTYDEDLNINYIFRDTYGLNLNVISWRNASPINKDWDEYMNIYGYHSVHYSASRDFNENNKNIKNKLLLFGCFGEIHRIDDNTYLDDVNFSDVTIDQYIDLYLLGHYWEKEQLLFSHKDRIHDHLKSKLLPLCEKWGINPNKIKAKEDILLWLERMHRSDNFMPNLMNRHHYCIFLNAQFPVIKHLTQIPPQIKSKARYQLDLIKYLCPSILEIPIFSRCQIQIYDQKSGIMILPSSVRTRHKIRRCLNSILPNKILDSIVSVYVRITESKKKREENDGDNSSVVFLRKLLGEHGINDGKDCTLVYRNRLLRPLVIFAQYIYIFDHSGIKFHKQ